MRNQGSKPLLEKQEMNETMKGFEKYKRWPMEKSTCPISGAVCVECGLFRGRHVHCSFFKRNLELNLSQKEIEQRRREAESELTAEKVWNITKAPKKISKADS
jgi:hypothetical protein